jgi:hypothetical protein
MLGSVCRVKQFRFGGKSFADKEEDETEMRSGWYFYSVGSEALVKRRDKCINVGAGYIKK